MRRVNLVQMAYLNRLKIHVIKVGLVVVYSLLFNFIGSEFIKSLSLFFIIVFYITKQLVCMALYDLFVFYSRDS